MRIVATTAIAALILGPGSDAAAQEMKSFHNAVARAPAAGTIFLYPERIPLQDGGFFNAERGIYFAPVNRSRSGSDVIGVEVYRFRASPQARPGTPPVFFLHGGPSFGGLEAGSEDRDLNTSALRFARDLGAVEAELYQVRNQSAKDKIAFPIKLNDRLTGLRSHLERGDAAPAEAYRTVFEELSAELDGHLHGLDRLIMEDLSRLNRQMAEAGLRQIVVRDPLIAP